MSFLTYVRDAEAGGSNPLTPTIRRLESAYSNETPRPPGRSMNVAMPRVHAAVLAVALLAFLPFARAQENVVMVNIDYFAESHRIRGANDARKSIADGRVEIHTDYGFEFMFAIPAGRQQRTREIATRKEILLEMGLVPRPYTGGGCIINPAADAYELAYQAVVDAHLKRRFGPDYLASIESEVQRRLRKGKKAPNPAGTSPIVRPASVARPHGGEAA